MNLSSKTQKKYIFEVHVFQVLYNNRLRVCAAPCGEPGDMCCPQHTSTETHAPGNSTATSMHTPPGPACNGRAQCIEGVCALCGGAGGLCCDSGACGLSAFGAPLACNANNICVVGCGVNGSACCTDADFAAVVDAYDEGLYEDGLGTGASLADDAAADAAFGPLQGCFGGTECGVGDVCTVPNPEDVPEYSDFIGTPAHDLECS